MPRLPYRLTWAVIWRVFAVHLTGERVVNSGAQVERGQVGRLGKWTAGGVWVIIVVTRTNILLIYITLVWSMLWRAERRVSGGRTRAAVARFALRLARISRHLLYLF